MNIVISSISNKNEFPKLHSFLDENNLVIRSAFAATDLDCAHCIQSKNIDRKAKITSNDFYVCFMFNAYEGSMFSWDLTNKPCMNEDQFVDKLKEILASSNKYVHFGRFKD